MFKGEKVDGLKFFHLLNESIEFTSELGKVTLAAGKLETELILFLISHNIKDNLKKSTLGGLIKIESKNNLLNSNELIAFDIVLKQRNYITHNIYSLLSDVIEETILEKNHLLDTDIVTYMDRIDELRSNLNDLTVLIQKKY